MLRRIGGAVLTVAVAFSPGIAGAAHQSGHPEDVTFTAPVPCWGACGAPVVHTDPYYDIGFDPCGAPVVPSSWADVVVTAPSWGRFLVFEIFPQMEWDSFICSPTGETLAAGVNIIGSCDGDLVFYGCKEKSLVVVEPGEQYVLRAFNSVDLSNCPGRYTFW